MFARIKKSGRYDYLQLVENRRDGTKTVQRVVATVGRLDELREKGRLEQVLQSLSRFSEKALLLVAQARHTPESRVVKIGPSLIGERLWSKTGIREILHELLGKRRFGFDGERAIYLTVLNRFVSPGSDRAAERWRGSYGIEGMEGGQP